jgi:RNA polymerase sigma factor (sigma-70 family)
LTEQEYMQRAEALKVRLYRTAYLYLGGESAAVDAVDDAVYKGFRGYHKLRQEEYFDTWLTRILINVCHGELRRRKRELAVETLPETASADYDALPLKEAIRRLPPDLGSVIVLRYFTGLTQEETARTLGIPRGTVSTRQSRALALLKLELED